MKGLAAKFMLLAALGGCASVKSGSHGDDRAEGNQTGAPARPYVCAGPRRQLDPSSSPYQEMAQGTRNDAKGAPARPGLMAAADSTSPRIETITATEPATSGPVTGTAKPAPLPVPDPVVADNAPISDTPLVAIRGETRLPAVNEKNLVAGAPSPLAIERTSSRTVDPPIPDTASLGSTSTAKVAPLPPSLPAPSDAKTPIIPGATPARLPTDSLDQAAVRNNGPAVRMVNSKRINLNYEVKDVGPSGVAAVDLWYTKDGKTWEKCETPTQRHSSYLVEVSDEGLYGFTLVARSGAGIGKQPPQPGDLPQVWVEVDQTKPVVRLQSVKNGSGTDAHSLTITWSATDKNLGPRPIAISYAEQADGPWVPIATNLENSGVHVWQMPPSVPARFHVRVEATDLVDNVGMARTENPILVDLSQPTVSILAVEAVVK